MALLLTPHHPKRLPPLSLLLSLSQGPFVSKNGHWTRTAHTKAYFTGPSAVLWLVAVVGMFIDNKQLIRFLPNELPHPRTSGTAVTSSRIWSQWEPHSRSPVSKPNDPRPAEAYFAFSSSSALEPLDSTRALLHPLLSPPVWRMYSNEQLSEKRASEKRGGDVEPGRRLRGPRRWVRCSSHLAARGPSVFRRHIAVWIVLTLNQILHSKLQKAGSARAHALESPRARGWQGRAHGWEGEMGRKRAM